MQLPRLQAHRRPVAASAPNNTALTALPACRATASTSSSDSARACRSITASGQAIVESSALVIEKGKKAASHVLEAAEADIEFSGGRFTITGTDRGINILDLAKKLQDGQGNGGPASLDVDHLTGDVQATYPNGCHVAEVEVDPDTGTVAIV